MAIANVLSIAGSDPSGGAGVQADLKALSAMGAYGMAVLTALTAQSTRGVDAVHRVPAAFVAAQLDTLAADVRIDATKIGMLGDAEVAGVVANAIERHHLRRVVLDPVMVSSTGHLLLERDAVEVVRSRLLPLADLVTPNLPEAAALLGTAPAADRAAMEEQAAALVGLGARRALVKGGHLGGDDSSDVLVEAGSPPRWVLGRRVATANDHGTGCTLSSAIAALVAAGRPWPEAVEVAKAYLAGALAADPRPDVGSGRGPVHHLWALRPFPSQYDEKRAQCDARPG